MLLMRESYEETAVRTLAEPVAVQAGQVGSIRVLRGQLLRITAQNDGAVASLFGFSLADPAVWLSVHHTRVFSNSYLLGSGMRLVNNRRRPMMVLGKDSVKRHDLLLPASTSAYLAERGYQGEGCLEAVRDELARLGMVVPKLPDPINLFMHVKLTRAGDILPEPNQTKAGDSITCRVVMDTQFIVSACNTGIEGNDRPAPLLLSVAENLHDFNAE
ncbi:TPA: urea carboxylase-associated family protein [Klebsiella pneumoniae]|nr:urea carboxylase-associated family protein [Klebsiella pneumoniae]HBW7250344.1 urea carboxylase-associated family protein [Klebsiella pneumoniae]HBW8163522.1 urea carboxylase-associated family protein [Klebsiella pneumoniae]HBW8261917.1 urea carboxylase-associated family protein [Klebsiella pneumoniae]HBW8267453.1 urea carboxylase-associated family protein [Klebsiella pneumoniae]